MVNVVTSLGLEEDLENWANKAGARETIKRVWR